MKKTTKFWTVKYETMTGETKIYLARTVTASQAVTECCQERTVGNLIGVWDSKKVQWI